MYIMSLMYLLLHLYVIWYDILSMTWFESFWEDLSIGWSSLSYHILLLTFQRLNPATYNVSPTQIYFPPSCKCSASFLSPTSFLYIKIILTWFFMPLFCFATSNLLFNYQYTYSLFLQNNVSIKLKMQCIAFFSKLYSIPIIYHLKSFLYFTLLYQILSSPFSVLVPYLKSYFYTISVTSYFSIINIIFIWVFSTFFQTIKDTYTVCLGFVATKHPPASQISLLFHFHPNNVHLCPTHLTVISFTSSDTKKLQN